ncbi:threonine synthase-like 1 [Patiria miniata]|uniref:Threonine synthase N-terminal domain-containing protein n=1 Tax=Patiria miniata TaxID=46514 RepID=A0A914AVJ3_PATMI|nr:threonine synthase-like 1 [Patiria miniata]XP_038067781.1 threonine synthase-like 1 [Patiria miniata]XP_038067782.1 threonine synthase-like 1 [Patiria miniata]XP_038067783.1 threonine synthase-like 1 [Patiria miniata]XP_038067784.1 threonine synthase-like 1 [Patiria miniata]
MAVSFLSRAARLYSRRCCAIKGSHPYQYSISKDGLKKRFSSDRFGERNNIILIGSPGCGKTTVGRILGQRLGRPVVDFDNDYLESYWGMTVAEKLSAVGQESFLAAESEALLNLDLKDSVLSLSGSSPMNRPAMQHAAQSGVVVFLDVDSRDIAQRLNRMKVDRIVGQRPGVSTLDLLAYRQQFYEGAYDVRILCERFQNADDIGEKVLTALCDHQKRPGYVSTRSDSEIQESAQPYKAPDFLDVVLQGLADDAGLYVPNKEPPHLTREEWTRLLGCTYQQRALRILEKWIHPRDFHPSSLATAVERAYSVENFQSESVVPVAHLQDNQYIMEVFHGPTASFKDAALQLMPQFFTQAVQMKGEKVRYMILVATSGDTGSAVLDGFSKFAGESGTLVMVLYPENGISEVQKLLMTAAAGDNVHVVGVDSDFDFCQTAIKGIFNDSALNAELLSNHGLRLSAANSINWGRLVPQVVYHASAYLDLVKQGVISMGDECDICIPTGNFGNILGAIYAKTMGIPFRKFICASNENNVLTEFIQTGCYDLRHRHLHVTMAPAIDILKSSNLERFLFLVTDGDGAEIRRCYEQLATEKYFQVSPKVLHRIQNEFCLAGDYCKEEEYAASIKKTLTQTGYLMDPHTAVAKVVADRLRPRDRPLLLCSTAHYSKFPTDVAKSLGSLSSPSDHPAESLRGLEALASRPVSHRLLREALERPRVHCGIVGASRDDVVNEMVAFAARATRG